MRSRVKLHRLRQIFILCATLGAPVLAQSDFPVVTFTLDFPGANPSHYVIAVSRDGRGTYTSNGQMSANSSSQSASADSDSNAGSDKTSAISAPENGPLDFTVSDHVRDLIFDLGQRAHYFSGKVDSARKNIASTGTKTLSYKDEHRQSEATYNYSTSAPVEQLTSVFEGLSETLEFGRRLAFFHKYQKLALDDDLKRMEEMQRDNSLGDMQAIASVLKAIADDPSVMNVARSRALRLLSSQAK